MGTDHSGLLATKATKVAVAANFWAVFVGNWTATRSLPSATEERPAPGACCHPNISKRRPKAPANECRGQKRHDPCASPPVRNGSSRCCLTLSAPKRLSADGQIPNFIADLDLADHCFSSLIEGRNSNQSHEPAPRHLRSRYAGSPNATSRISHMSTKNRL